MNLALKVALTKHRKRDYQIAILAGMSQSTLSKIVNGVVQPSKDQKRSIAEVLRVSIRSIFPPEVG